MRFKTKDYKTFKRWFAWRPVRIGDNLSRDWVWWEWVERGYEYAGASPIYRLPVITATGHNSQWWTK